MLSHASSKIFSVSSSKDIKTDGTALHLAVITRRPNIVDLLLEKAESFNLLEKVQGKEQSLTSIKIRAHFEL